MVWLVVGRQNQGARMRWSGCTPAAPLLRLVVRVLPVRACLLRMPWAAHALANHPGLLTCPPAA